MNIWGIHWGFPDYRGWAPDEVTPSFILCDMLAISRDRIDKLIKEGKTLEEVIAADPTSNLYKGGKSWLSPKLFVYVVYHDLSK